MTTEIWLLRWSYWRDDDYRWERDESYESTPDFGFFLTKEEAQTEVDKLNAPDRASYAKYLENLKTDFDNLTKEYERKTREDKEEEKKNKLLKAHGFATKPIPTRRAPVWTEPKTYDQFHVQGSYWEVFKIERATA